MTRALQNRLALANVKIKHGWENLSIDAIEPQIDEHLKRKRPSSSTDTTSDSASSISDRFHAANAFNSSPLTAPMFSDDVDRCGSSHGAKRLRGGGARAMLPASGSQTGRRLRNSAGSQSWKRSYQLPESSPVYHAKHARFPAQHVSKLSFISEGSTVADETLSPELSEDDDTDLPVHSFHLRPSHIQSSPPRTPPPQRRLLNKAANVSWSRTPRTGEEGADLLMYLATSPTPANMGANKTRILAPTTPPSKATPLPSSMMSTPGGGGFGLFGFAPATPSNNFNLADFCNVTPSPAQGNWPRTPAATKTPLTTREARRKINFDALVPPTSSPSMTRSPNARETGLGMELGGELMS